MCVKLNRSSNISANFRTKLYNLHSNLRCLYLDIKVLQKSDKRGIFAAVLGSRYIFFTGFRFRLLYFATGSGSLKKGPASQDCFASTYMSCENLTKNFISPQFLKTCFGYMAKNLFVKNVIFVFNLFLNTQYSTTENARRI